MNPRPAEVLLTLLDQMVAVPASDLISAVRLAGDALGASDARLLVADYGLTALQELGKDGPVNVFQPIEGTSAGRCFARGDVVVSGEEPSTVWVLLADGTERLGVFELTHPSWSDELQSLLDPIVRLLVLVLISKRRYTDVMLRSRRAAPLSLAAEMQWDLLPPLTCSTEQVSLSGTVQPAYSIGGDSFDYALNPNRAEFAIVDAVGHGMGAVSIAVVAINSLRNARREGANMETAYLSTGDAISAQFGQSNFATAQLGSLALDTGELTWLNAGHPLPLLVRNRSFVGELQCRPSMPMGLGGPVTEVATEVLQPGDRVLFYTDGVVESTAPNGQEFGIDRLADLLTRAALDEVSPAETVRRLAEATVAHTATDLRDDATLLLVEYHQP